MNKQKTNYTLVIIVVALSVLTLAVLMKFFTPEDTWLCSDGQWVRHGNSGIGIPIEECE